ncbi:hypothetical protein WA026_006940 [Henosepilachna vigintioctopunctata]|uniref:Cuticle protein 6 n=1 Tax=Henosepilachna vigintioctopunctata TaxID=420089 RepID=A0AAW1V925_9CUCU
MNLPALILVTTMVSYTAGSTVGFDLHPELHPIRSLYHSQDYYGRYSYGYSTPMITRNEVRTSDGVTRGGYSYMDSNGILQSVQYTSDPVHGFQVAATNLPQDLPDVAAAKARHLALFNKVQAGHSVVAVPQPVQDLPEVVAARQAHLAILESARAGVIPQPIQDTPEVARAKADHLAILEATRARDELARRTVHLSPIRQSITGTTLSGPSQSTGPLISSNLAEYKPAVEGNQANFGLYTYGYVGPLSSHAESRTADGVTRGGYSFIDAFGKLQHVRYVADDRHGFRVEATNLLTTPTVQNIESQPSALPHKRDPLYQINKPRKRSI